MQQLFLPVNAIINASAAKLAAKQNKKLTIQK